MQSRTVALVSRRSRATALALVGVLLCGVWLILPAKTITARIDSAALSISSATVSGAFHVHTTRSDGNRTAREVAAAAEKAGLDFVILSDHGDGRREPEPPRYMSNVLVVDSVEISTTEGHYVALDMPRTPYRLGGDAASVVEDVRRFGGFGIIAHPASPSSSLEWRAMAMAAETDAIEWLNADSAWRNESILRLALSLGSYPFRPSETIAALLDRPTDALARWDRMTRSNAAIVGLAGADAHSLIDHEAMFRTFSLHIELETPWSGNAESDGAQLIRSIREGRVFAAIDAIARPAVVRFEAEDADGATYTTGQIGPVDTDSVYDIRVVTSFVPETRIELFRDGRRVMSTLGPELLFRTRPGRTGSYRAEVVLDRRSFPGEPGAVRTIPWIVTNAIRLVEPRDTRELTPDAGPPNEPQASLRASRETIQPSDAEGERQAAWSLEHDDETDATVTVSDETIVLAYSLGRTGEGSPYAAAANHFRPGALDGAQGITFEVSADRPVRISCQLRDGARPGTPRWRKSFWADESPRQVTIRFRDMTAVGPGQTTAPETTRTDSLLFVADLVNSERGDSAVIRFSHPQIE